MLAGRSASDTHDTQRAMHDSGVTHYTNIQASAGGSCSAAGSSMTLTRALHVNSTSAWANRLSSRSMSRIRQPNE
jgi:hypothetical protein